MRIQNDITRAADTKVVEPSSSDQNNERRRIAAVDRIQVSTEAKSLLENSGQRAAKLKSLKEQLEAGTFQIDRQKLAARILGDNG